MPVVAAFELDDLIASGEPALLKGVAADWLLVRKGLQSSGAAIDYLKTFDAGRPVVGYTGAPEIGGRFFYNDDLTGFNFHRQPVPLGPLLHELLRLSDERVASPHALYAGSATAPTYLPGWQDANPLGLPTGDAAGRVLCE